MKDCSYKRLVEETVLTNFRKQVEEGNVPFAISDESEVVNRVLTLESLILASDLLYKCVTFEVICSTKKEIEILKFLISLSDALVFNGISEEIDGFIRCSTSLNSDIHKKAFRDSFFDELYFFNETFVNDISQSGFYARILNVVQECLFEGMQVSCVELTSYLENNLIKVDILNLNTLDEKVKYLEGKYVGLGDFSVKDFQVDLKDFEKLFSYLKGKYEDTIVDAKGNRLGFKFDFSKVVALVDLLYEGTHYTKLFDSMKSDDFCKKLGTESFYDSDKYNPTLYDCFVQSGIEKFKLSFLFKSKSLAFDEFKTLGILRREYYD